MTALDLATREAIVRSAEAAAKQMVRDKVQAVNPQRPGSVEYGIWKAALERFLLRYSAPDADGGA